MYFIIGALNVCISFVLILWLFAKKVKLKMSNYTLETTGGGGGGRENSTEINCETEHIFCFSNPDCLAACKQKNNGNDDTSFICKNNKCTVIQKTQTTISPIHCDSERGGIRFVTLEGNISCFCTLPTFFVGESCDTPNPLICQNGYLDITFYPHIENMCSCPLGRKLFIHRNVPLCVPIKSFDVLKNSIYIEQLNY